MRKYTKQQQSNVRQGEQGDKQVNNPWTWVFRSCSC